MRRARRVNNTWSAVAGRVAHAREGFLAALPVARARQETLLARILRENAASAYGRRHGFDGLRDAREYQRRVPVAGYEDLEADIDTLASSGGAVLTTEPVIAFERTGGSRGGSKLVPYTRGSIESFRTALKPWLDDLLLSYPGIARGGAYWALSPAARRPERTASGIPVGMESDADYFGPELAQAIARTFVIPAQIARLPDLDAWRFITLTALLAREDLAFISVWSPSFLIELLRPLADDASRSAVIDAIGAGSFGAHAQAAREAGLPDFPSQPARARLLEQVLGADWTLKDLWPRLALLSCWTHASSRLFLPHIAKWVEGVEVQGKGLIATEAIVSLPVAALPYPVLAIDSGFYEFIDEEGSARLCDELDVGASYALVITTRSGLYRYRIGDLVCVRGYAGAAPLLEFVGREGAAVDLVGEKLREDFVVAAIDPLVTGFWMLAPSVEGRPHYRLIAEALGADERLAAAADRALCGNPQYAYARSLGQLGAVRVTRCPDLAHRWLMHVARDGRRIGDAKPPVLAGAGDAAFLSALQ